MNNVLTVAEMASARNPHVVEKKKQISKKRQQQQQEINFQNYELNKKMKSSEQSLNIHTNVDDILKMNHSTKLKYLNENNLIMKDDLNLYDNSNLNFKKNSNSIDDLNLKNNSNLKDLK
jgi:hypothetical protein